MGVALSAILGHAFSPLLQLKGGKAIAVTFGILVALPQHEILITFIAFILLGLLFIEINAWAVIFGANRLTGLSTSYKGKLMGSIIYAVRTHSANSKTF